MVPGQHALVDTVARLRQPTTRGGQCQESAEPYVFGVFQLFPESRDRRCRPEAGRPPARVSCRPARHALRGGHQLPPNQPRSREQRQWQQERPGVSHAHTKGWNSCRPASPCGQPSSSSGMVSGLQFQPTFLPFFHRLVFLKP